MIVNLENDCYAAVYIDELENLTHSDQYRKHVDFPIPTHILEGVIDKPHPVQIHPLAVTWIAAVTSTVKSLSFFALFASLKFGV